MKENMTNFRVFGPDENTSNKLDAIYEVTQASSGSPSTSRRTPTAPSWPPTAA